MTTLADCFLGIEFHFACTELVRNTFYCLGKQWKIKRLAKIRTISVRPTTDRMGIGIINVLLMAQIAAASQMPFIANMTPVPVSQVSPATISNRTCDQCLCTSNSSYPIVNCLPDNTCQLFASFPRTYTLQWSLHALLYFPQGIIPNASQDYTANTTALVDLLNATTPTYANVSGPRCLILDDHGYLVTVSKTNQSIVRFHPNNLTEINIPASPIFSDQPISIAQSNGAYYVGFDTKILVVHSDNMTQLCSINIPFASGVRDIIFLDQGKMMIVASPYHHILLFFNRSSTGSYNYDFMSAQNVSCPNPHGLLYINDSFFYATSWRDNAVYAYARNATSWIETLFLDAWPATGSSQGYHVFIDRDHRTWFSLGPYGLRVFDSQGSTLGTLKPPGSEIFDAIILENYVIYLSDISSNRIIRLDPGI